MSLFFKLHEIIFQSIFNSLSIVRLLCRHHLGWLLLGHRILGTSFTDFGSFLVDSALVVEVFLGLWLVVLVLLLLLLVHFSQTIFLLLRLVLTVLDIRLLLQLLGVQPPHLLLHELGVQKNQSLLHDLERLGHLLVVVLKLSENVLGLGSWQVDQQRLG